MWPTAVIVFREFLEVALILGVLLAATQGLAGRARWFVLGIVGGVAGAVVIAFSAEAISNALDGFGQEVFNAVILFTAVIMVTWTVVWMKKHGREITRHLREVGHSVTLGEAPMYTLSLVIALSVFREGAEIVLFTYGYANSGQASLGAILLGGVLGGAGGLLAGLLMYLGLLHMARKYLFSVTSWLLIFLAAGMAATGAQFLIGAGFLPELTPTLWDTSSVIPQDGTLGMILHALIGYTDRPSGMQVAFYAGTIAVISALLYGSAMRTAKAPATPA